ncbi:MAG: IS200/IS605 family element transposase accessory protein TnpB [Methanobacteriota archaeon]|nr:MAG: IS200/IS605 family element transposase accessory protein TnpB [Euryarchaeota archaeon]
MGSRLVRVNRTLAFALPCRDSQLEWLLREFRLIVNKSIRIAVEGNIRSRTKLARAAYAELSREHAIYKQYIPSAFEVALGALKAYRRRIRKGNGLTGARPYLNRLLLKAENQSYKLDRKTGLIRIPVSGRRGLEFVLPLSRWHRQFLDDREWTLGSLTLIPGKLLLVVRRDAPRPPQAEGSIALDTNEDSLDGVFADANRAMLLSVPLGGVRSVQATHFRRRRRLSQKKSGDVRVLRRLLAREGRRERNRVRQRLHRVTKELICAARVKNAAIVLEDLAFNGIGGRSRRMKRRLSSWPRGEMHRQIDYKAALAGVSVIKVNPAWTSKTCPVCGARRRDRVGKDFVCLVCDWEMDRQHNAALNILKSALTSNEALARAVRFQPGALRHDVVSPLYDLSAREGAREEPSGVESDALRI